MCFCIIKTEAQKRIVVAQDGSGNYKTVQEAINAVADNSASVTEVFVKKGTYKERIVVPLSKINITLIGEDAMATVLTFDNYAARLDSAGKALGTSRSASFYVYGGGFTARDITFENAAGPVGQALAIYVAGDKAAFYNCRFLGFQDTIYTNGKGAREYYKDCYIEGTTDFIFGSATVLFEHCHIHSKKNSHITAASTPQDHQFGYVFDDCILTGDTCLHSVSLGRPWRRYASVTYIHCYLGEHIKPEGWSNWNQTDNYKTTRYSEYQNYGPGAQISNRVEWSRQLTDAEVKKYTIENVLSGWQPKDCNFKM